MGVAKAKRIGRAGPAGKFQIPDGFSLWKYTETKNSGSILINFNIAIHDSTNCLFRLPDRSVSPDFEEDDIVVFNYHARFRYASHAWSSSSPDARVDIRLTKGTRAVGGSEVYDFDTPLTESVDCSNQEICANSLPYFPPFRLAAGTVHGTSPTNPLGGLDIDEVLDPTVETTCLVEASAGCMVLIKNDLVVSAGNSNPGELKFLGGTPL